MTPMNPPHVLTALLLAALASTAQAQAPAPAAAAAAAPRIGFINTQRVMHDAIVAQRAHKAIESEFRSPHPELQRHGERIKTSTESLQKNAVTMSEAEQRTKERELTELRREFDRKQ